jgi:hypothetical protein
LAPESLAKISIGGSTVPSSMENLVANSNVLELIEESAAAGDLDAKNLMRRINLGSHIAATDVHMQSVMRRFELDESLDFLDMSKLDSASVFVKSARKQYLTGGAFTATTNIADVAHIEQTARDYLSNAGARNVMLDISGSELGLSTTAEGQLRYNKSIESFEFVDTSSGAVRTTPVDEALAKTRISTRLQGISSSVNEGISVQNFSYLDATKVDEAFTGRRSVQGITATTDAQKIIRSLGLTDEQFGAQNSVSSIFSQFRQTGAEQGIRDLQPVLSLGQNVINSYYQNAARSGLGFSSLNVQDRVMSVKLAQATSGIGKMAAGTERASRSMAHAKHAGLLGEMGLSYFNAQTVTRLVGAYDSAGPLPASKVMAKFESLFDYETTTAADGSIARTLKVKAFDDGRNIIDSNLNRFTLSYIAAEDTPEGVSARINLIWGANKTLSEQEARKHAVDMLANAEQHVEYISDLTGMASIRELDNTALAAMMAAQDSDQKERLVLELTEKIREKGVVAGSVEGHPVAQMVEALKIGGIDLVDNDVRVANHHMRLVHSENGVLTMSALRNDQSDLAIGLTDEMAQREAEQALDMGNELGEMFEDKPYLRRDAERVIRESRTSRALGEEVDFSTGIKRDLKAPMTEFFIRNKTKLGYAGIGLAAAGIGYYIGKKNREAKLYDETVKSQPTEPGNPRRAIQRSQASLANPQSTRRDPLVTAGIVGNLDRNKIGHTQMGPNKYNHLYGG